MKVSDNRIRRVLEAPLTVECLKCSHSRVLPFSLNQHCLNTENPTAMLKHLYFRLICSVCSGKDVKLLAPDSTVIMSRTQPNPIVGDRLLPVSPPKKSKRRRSSAKQVSPAAQFPAKPFKIRAPNECLLCGCAIEPERLEALPQTNTCIDCANKKSGQTKRVMAEPWGTRADWKRDSGANFARSVKPKL